MIHFKFTFNKIFQVKQILIKNGVVQVSLDNFLHRTTLETTAAKTNYCFVLCK